MNLQMTDRIKESFEQVSLETIQKYTHGVRVFISNNGYSEKGTIIKAPYFIIQHIEVDPLYIEGVCG